MALVLYTFRRYYCTYSEQETSLEMAVARAFADVEYNNAYPVKIEAIDGSFCYERGEFMDWDGPLDRLMKEHQVRTSA